MFFFSYSSDHFSRKNCSHSSMKVSCVSTVSFLSFWLCFVPLIVSSSSGNLTVRVSVTDTFLGLLLVSMTPSTLLFGLFY